MNKKLQLGKEVDVYGIRQLVFEFVKTPHSHINLIMQIETFNSKELLQYK